MNDFQKGLLNELDRFYEWVKKATIEEVESFVESAQKHNPSQYAKLERMIMGGDMNGSEVFKALTTSLEFIETLRDAFLSVVNATSNAELYQFMHEFDEKYLPFRDKVTKG